MKWVVTLNSDPTCFNDVFFAIIITLKSVHSDLKYILKDIEANGVIGREMSSKNKDGESVEITWKEIVDLFNSKDTQLIEFELNLMSKGEPIYSFLVRDGYYADILGSGQKFSTDIMGEFTEMDRTSYGW
jgi:hypothetical protein